MQKNDDNRFNFKTVHNYQQDDLIPIYEVEVMAFQDKETLDNSNSFNAKLQVNIKSSTIILKRADDQQVILVNLQVLMLSYYDQEQFSIHLTTQQKPDTLQYKFQCRDIEQTYQLLEELQYSCTQIYPQFSSSFKIGKLISQGSQASIFECKKKGDSEEQNYIVKRYVVNSDETRNQIRQEVQILRRLRPCQNISQISVVFEEQSEYSIVMNHAQDGDLFQLVQEGQRFSEAEIRILMLQLLLTLDFTHKSDIIHRDLKPENILLLNSKNLEIQIADFGVSCFDDDLKQKLQKFGTPGFIAPEIIQGLGFSYQTDIFSLGCLFFMLIYGKSLYQGINLLQILEKNKTQDPIEIVNEQEKIVSDDCLDLLRKMLQQSPFERPLPEQCLIHEWFSNEKQAIASSMINNVKHAKQAYQEVVRSEDFPLQKDKLKHLNFFHIIKQEQLKKHMKERATTLNEQQSLFKTLNDQNISQNMTPKQSLIGSANLINKYSSLRKQIDILNLKSENFDKIFNVDQTQFEENLNNSEEQKQQDDKTMATINKVVKYRQFID
ncbi:serine threonine protein kinase [Stylonychia lemnae]|uniref:Serine threonine protein kinase n=1 Tax=Stylonychia lemnae TaxID=5949 RepID=A0A077ZUL7_STYLE|nr:serine threonine protein kinase [Stylonychia lemnae]|eukprot:CDW72156.1 serine threonine protein kinase [Stylonychia lemnae]